MVRDFMMDLRSIFGVRAQVTTSAESTGGALVETDCTAEPGSATMAHLHPDQEETFRVIEGALEVLDNGRWKPLMAGESHRVPKGAVHAWRNAAEVPARFINVHRPALGFEEHMAMLDRLVKDGKVRGTSDPRSLIYLSMSAARYQPGVTVRPPQWVVRATAALGRLLGFRLEEDREGGEGREGVA